MMMLSFLSQKTMSQPGLDNGTAQNSWQSLHQSGQKAARKEKTLGNSLDFPAFASSESSLERWVGLRRTGLTAAPCCSKENNTRTNHETMCIQIKKCLPLCAPKLSNTLSYRDKEKSGSDRFSLEGFVLFPVCYLKKVKVLVTQLCQILCDLTDCSPPGSSVHGTLQAGILEWVAIPFFRGSS